MNFSHISYAEVKLKLYITGNLFYTIQTENFLDAFDHPFASFPT